MIAADLYRLVPDARQTLAPLADLVLRTHLSATPQLHLPQLWECRLGRVAFFGFQSPARPAGFGTDSPVVRCTAEDCLRDAWIHGYSVFLEGSAVWFPSARVSTAFRALLGAQRGVQTAEAELDAHRLTVRAALGRAKRRILRRAAGRTVCWVRCCDCGEFTHHQPCLLCDRTTCERCQRSWRARFCCHTRGTA